MKNLYAALKRRYRNPWLFGAGLVFFHLLMLGAYRHKVFMIIIGLGGMLGCFLSYPNPPEPEDGDGDKPRKEQWDDPAVRVGIGSFVFIILIAGLWMHNHYVTLSSLILLIGYKLLVRWGAKRAASKATEPE